MTDWVYTSQLIATDTRPFFSETTPGDISQDCLAVVQEDTPVEFLPPALLFPYFFRTLDRVYTGLLIATDTRPFFSENPPANVSQNLLADFQEDTPTGVSEDLSEEKENQLYNGAPIVTDIPAYPPAQEDTFVWTGPLIITDPQSIPSEVPPTIFSPFHIRLYVPVEQVPEIQTKVAEPEPATKAPSVTSQPVKMSPLKGNLSPQSMKSETRPDLPSNAALKAKYESLRAYRDFVESQYDDLTKHLKDLELYRPGRKLPKSEQNVFRPPMKTSDAIKYEEARWHLLDLRIKWLYPANIQREKVCPWVPRTLEHYLRHCREVKKAVVELLEYKMASIPRGVYIPIGKPFGGKQFGSSDSLANPTNLSPVLCRETIWTPGFIVPWAPVVEWPTAMELEWEGPSRIQTEHGRYGRMLPIPRVPYGWPGHHPDYKECARAYPFVFDDVQPVLDYETIWHPPENPEDPILPTDVLKQIDNPIW